MNLLNAPVAQTKKVAHGYMNVATVVTLCVTMMMDYLDGIILDAGRVIDAQVVQLLKRKTA